MGVPCAVSRYVAGTLPFRERDLGLVLDDDPGAAAGQLSEALQDHARLAHWSAAGAAYAADHFDPSAVAHRSMTGYQAILAGRTAPLKAAR